MTMATNALHSSVAKGNREDLTDIIYNIDPTDTPFISLAGKMKPKGVYHEWQSQALAAASSTNAQLEGNDITPAAATATTRWGNYTQISVASMAVTGTQEVVDHAGRDSEAAYQIALKGKELKRDIEKTVSGNQGYQSSTTSTEARKARTIESFIYTNKNRLTTNSTDTALQGVGTTDPTAAAQDANSTRALTETILKNVIAQVYASGGEADTILVGPYNKGVISGFTGRTSAVENVKVGTIQAAASIYASDFGNLKVMPSRFCRERTALVLDPNYVKVGYLRPFKVEELAKTGDSIRKFMLAEWTLECHEKAHGVAADIATA